MLRNLTGAIALAALVSPAAAAAATPQPPDCPLYAIRPAKEYPIDLPGGGRVIARDPYAMAAGSTSVTVHQGGRFV